MNEALKLGLVIAGENDPLGEIERFITDKQTDIFLFPEYHVPSKKLSDARAIVRKNHKWVITGVADRRSTGHFYQTAVVINPEGEIVGEHQKTSITKYEIGIGQDRGDELKTITTPFGVIGIAICYELHLPEIARVYALAGASIIFNPIGTGMWHEQQYGVWNRLAATRAYENGVFVVGSSHYNDAIPIAFAYAPNGDCLIQERSVNKLIPVTLDPSKYTIGRNFSQRRPELYSPLVQK